MQLKRPINNSNSCNKEKENTSDDLEDETQKASRVEPF